MKRHLLLTGLSAFVFFVPPAYSASSADPAVELATQGNGLRSAADAARLASIKYLQQYAGGIKPLVQSLVTALSDKNADVRSGAARALAEIGPSAREAAAVLIPLLNDKDETVRANAAAAIGEIGVPSDAAFCGLAFLLQDANGNIRGIAAQALGKFGPAADAHRSALLEMLKDPNSETAINAALALASLGEPVPEAARLYALALARESSAKKLAENALRKFGLRAVAALQLVIKEEKDRYIRREAISMLGKLGESARPAIPELVEALGDKEVDIQNYAAMALVDLGAAPIEASAAMLRMMKEWNEFRPKALDAFEKLNDHAADLPLAILSDKDDIPLQREAARVLSRLAPRFKDHPEQLLSLLNHPDHAVRLSILEALSACGANSRKLAAPLAPMLNDPNYTVALLAVKTLSAMREEPSAVAALAEARLRHPNASLKAELAKAVLALGADARPALPSLREALKSEDVYTRDWAMQVLAAIGPAASEAIPDLIVCLIRFVPYRVEAARTLGKLGEKGIDPLMALLASTDPAIRSSAATALGNIGVPALEKAIAAVADNNPDKAEAALLVLDRMAPASAPAIPELIRAANSKIVKIQNAASLALARLGPLAAPALIAEIRKPDENLRHTAAIAMSQTGAKSVPSIVEVLRAEQDPGIVCALLDCLARIGPGAAESVPAILDTAGRLYGPKDRGAVWSRCAYALGAMGTMRETAVPLLFGMLLSEDKLAHAEAAAALRKLGGEDLRVPPLADALRNAAPIYVGGALKPFGRAGMLQLAAEMESGVPDSRDAAARAFVQLAPECIPFLLQTLDENPAASVGTLLAMGEIRAYEMERRAAKAVPKTLEELQKALDACTPALLQKIKSGSADEALAALWALGKPGDAGLEPVIKNFAACSPDLIARGVLTLGYFELNGQSRALVPVLPILLNEAVNRQSSVRKKAGAMLKAAGYCAQSVPVLVEAIDDPDKPARAIAGAALQTLGPDARAAIPKLIQILERGTPPAAAIASLVLTTIGTEAVPELIKALTSDNLKLRTSSYSVLATLKLAPYITLLADAAADKRQDVSLHAVQLIGTLKEEGRAAERKVRELLTRDDDLVFHECVKTLAKMGANMFAALAPLAEHPNAEIAARAMHEMQMCPATADGEIRAFVGKELKHENPAIRSVAVSLLPGKVNGAPESMPLAAQAMKDASYSVRLTAMVWLYDNAPFNPDASLPLLMAGMKDSYETVRTVSHRALIQMGPKARPAVPELKALLNNPSKEIQTNVARVLVKMGVEDEPLAALIFNETSVYAIVAEYHEKQGRFFEEHFTEENVHYFAPAFLEAWGAAGKEFAANAEPDGAVKLTGYKLITLIRQSARAEGGKKEWQIKGVLSGGSALLAWPVQPGVTGRVAYMSGPDGAIYERAVGPQDAPRLAEIAEAFDPGPEWTKIFAPEKAPARIPHSYFKPKGTEAESLEF